MYQPPFPRPPPPKRNNTLGCLILLGIPLLLVLGAFAFCVVSVKRHDQKAALAKASAESAGRVFVPTLAKIIADPKASGATAKQDKEETTFTYPDQAELGLVAISQVVVKGRGGAWRLSFGASPGTALSRDSFGTPEYGYLTAPPEGWILLGDGPLKGATLLIEEGGRSAVLASPSFFLSKMHGSDVPKMTRWACDSGLGGITAVTGDAFLDRCKSAVRAQLLLPESADFHSVGISHQVLTSADCSHSWTSDVESKNAFGVVIKHGFTCHDSPQSGIEAVVH